MTYKTEHFKIEELVCPELLKSIKEDILWEMFDKNLLVFADFVRETYGITTCNTVILTDCGARTMDNPHYPKYDPHKYFRALDLHIVSIDKENLGPARDLAYNELRLKLLKDYASQVGIDNIHFENDISWLHIDTYNRPNISFNGEKNV
jgi:hypothetical protein